MANAAKLTEIEEVNINEKENDRKFEITSIPPPSSNRISTPLPDLVNKQSNQVQNIQSLPGKGIEIISAKENSTTKKKKIKEPTSIVSKQTMKLVRI